MKFEEAQMQDEMIIKIEMCHFPTLTKGFSQTILVRLVDVGALLGRSKVYKFAKRFDNHVIQGKDVLPAHKQYPIMTRKSKLVTPDVVFNILNAELSLLATSFAISLNANILNAELSLLATSYAISLNAGSALVENPNNLFVESYKTSPVLHVQESPVPNSILVRLWVQNFIQKRLSLPERPPAEPKIIPTPSAQRPERIPNPPVELKRSAEPLRMPPAEPLRMPPAEPKRMPTTEPQRMPPAEPQRMPPAEPEIPSEPERPPIEMVAPSVSVNTVEVTPLLITRCDKSTHTIFP
ncbi:uncharacterized protein TNCV_3994581 [Trichonephila clavipes]|nr:uncharacterized protein TNCV_3994581 [Trichonephila clavipes]